MAEVLVLGPAVIALIQISDRIVGLCIHYIETVKDAPSGLKTILVEISFLKTTLETLNILTSCSSNASAQGQVSQKLKDPIEECLRLVPELEKLFPPETQQSPSNASKRQKVKATFAQLAWPLKESKARKLLEGIRPLKETLNLELTSQSHHEIREIKTQTSRTHEVVTETQRQEIFRWLQHTDPSSLYYKAQKDYEPNTGNWVFRTPEWLDWIDSKSRCLWIHGIPGAGKTVLISHLIKAIRTHCETPERDGCVCVYYFCFYGHNQDEGKPFLRWLINQLCRQSKSVPSAVLSLYKYGGEPSLVSLLEALEATLQAFKTAFVVVDALDECQPRDEMLRIVRRLVEDTRFQNLQLLASSRRYNDIEKTMQRLSRPLSMDNDYVNADIRTHVHSSLHSSEKFRRFPLELLDEIEDAVSKGAKGMFRWAVCQLDILQRLKCESDIIRKALKDLPETLQETYDRILLSLSEEDRLVVRCLFEWIPLYSEVWRHGIPCQILVQVAERCTSKSNALQSGYFYDEDTIKELCGCLIRISPEKIKGIKLRVVNFAHYTVREYVDSGGLLRNAVAQLATAGQCSMQRPLHVIFEEAHQLNLNAAGMQKLLSSDPKSVLEMTSADFNISCTVSALFALSTRASEISQQDPLFNLAIGLFDPSGACFGSLCSIAERMEGESEFFWSRGVYGGFGNVRFCAAENPSAMQLLCLLRCVGCNGGSLRLIERVLEKKGGLKLMQDRLRFYVRLRYDKASKDYLVDGSIIEAAAQGFLPDSPAFAALLELCRGFFDPSKVLRLCIGGKITGEDYDMPQTLLELGADPNARNQRVTSLQIAVFNRDLDSVTLLLQAKADPNEAGSNTESPWEDQSWMSQYNHLHGASPLYICRKLENPHILEENSGAAPPEEIEAILLKYGAESFVRPESALGSKS